MVSSVDTALHLVHFSQCVADDDDGDDDNDFRPHEVLFQQRCLLKTCADIPHSDWAFPLYSFSQCLVGDDDNTDDGKIFVSFRKYLLDHVNNIFTSCFRKRNGQLIALTQFFYATQSSQSR